MNEIHSDSSAARAAGQTFVIAIDNSGDYLNHIAKDGEIRTGSIEDANIYTAEEADEVSEWLSSEGTRHQQIIAGPWGLYRDGKLSQIFENYELAGAALDSAEGQGWSINAGAQ